jgi:co-chaperonin GroES (HSP10)
MSTSRPRSGSDKNLETGSAGYVPSNTAGISLDESPIEAYNHTILLRMQPQQKKGSKIFIPESAKAKMNSAIIVACGGEVENAKELLGKHIVFAKFRYAEPFKFTKPDGSTEDYLSLEDRDIIGYFKNQDFSAQYSVAEPEQSQVSQAPRIAKPH